MFLGGAYPRTTLESALPVLIIITACCTAHANGESWIRLWHETPLRFRLAGALWKDCLLFLLFQLNLISPEILFFFPKEAVVCACRYKAAHAR